MKPADSLRALELLAHLNVVGLSPEQLVELAARMGLRPDQIKEILARSAEVYEFASEVVSNGERHPRQEGDHGEFSTAA